MSKTKVGLIGCGARVRHVLPPHPEIEVAALCDPQPESIQAAQAQYGTSARVYPHYQDLVTDPAVQWVVVGSWNCFHREHAVAALRAGKDVFCEKPLATTLEDCLAIREAVRTSGRRFFFGLVLRYSAFYRKLSELLHAGAAGRIISFEFNETIGFNHGGFIMGDWRRLRRNAGTHVLEKCCHDMDLANWLTGSLPVRVASFGGLNFYRPENRRHVERIGRDAQGREAYFAWPGRQLDPFTADRDIVDNQVVILEYANGVRATFHTNCNAGLLERRFYLLGSEGAIRANAGRIEVQRIGFETTPVVYNLNGQDGHAGGDAIMRTALFDSMVRGAPPLVGIDEALRSAIVCFAIDQALDDGRVVDLRPRWEQAGIPCA